VGTLFQAVDMPENCIPRARFPKLPYVVDFAFDKPFAGKPREAFRERRLPLYCVTWPINGIEAGAYTVPDACPAAALTNLAWLR